jgi:hypothetical protein
MSNAPRLWLQLHLSTCVVLMFVAGGLMWANLQPRETTNRLWPGTEYGWPLVARSDFVDFFRFKGVTRVHWHPCQRHRGVLETSPSTSPPPSPSSPPLRSRVNGGFDGRGVRHERS